MVMEQISQMKQQGMQTKDIIQNLKQQGISPKEINEALSQSEIKSEITNTQGVFPGAPTTSASQPAQQSPAGQPPAQPGQTSTQQTPSTAEMQPSIGQTGMQQQASMDMQTPVPAMNPQISQPAVLEPATQDYSQYQEYAPEGDAGYYPEYSGGGGGTADIETINDISSQLIDEKTKHFKKEFSEFTGFKKDSQNKLEELDQRLTKIEDHIEELKMAIIRKIGDYGDDINKLANEMQATRDSFGKIINPLTENAKMAKAVKEAQPKTESKPKTQKSSKADTFEDYLR